MKKRRIGSLSVSEIGMGCMGFSHGYGEIPDEDYSIGAIRKAYAYGCTFYDTAEVYSPLLSGLGHNERLLGKSLRDVRKEVVIATKITLKMDEVRQPGLVPAKGRIFSVPGGQPVAGKDQRFRSFGIGLYGIG